MNRVERFKTKLKGAIFYGYGLISQIKSLRLGCEIMV